MEWPEQTLQALQALQAIGRRLLGSPPSALSSECCLESGQSQSRLMFVSAWLTYIYLTCMFRSAGWVGAYMQFETLQFYSIYYMLTCCLKLLTWATCLNISVSHITFMSVANFGSRHSDFAFFLGLRPG